MTKSLYSALVEPHYPDLDTRNHELALNYVLLGVLFLISSELVAVLFGSVMFNQQYSAYRLLGILVALILFASLYWLVRKRHYQRAVAVFVTSFFLVITSATVVEWGSVTPTGILLFSSTIIMAGILVSTRYALYMGVTSLLILTSLEYLKTTLWVQPNLIWMRQDSDIGDILGFSVIYVVIALISWLFNHRLEQSLRSARHLQAELSKQNNLLEATVKERTRQLEAEQLEKVQQVYRFAELGRVSSGLFHDLANHLSSVTLDIEGLSNNQQSALMRRIQSNIRYIDDVVQRVRLQLSGQGSIEDFQVIKEVARVVTILNYKLVQSHINLEINEPSGTIHWHGDVVPFRQIINNLLSNAVESYDKSRAKKPKVIIEVMGSDKNIVIRVTDWGVGIPANKQAKIFEPFYSSKADGTGIGLYLVKQIVERDLQGKISLTSSRRNGTVFTVKLPRHGNSLSKAR